MVFSKHIGVIDSSLYFHMMLVLTVFFTKKKSTHKIISQQKVYEDRVVN